MLAFRCRVGKQSGNEGGTMYVGPKQAIALYENGREMGCFCLSGAAWSHCVSVPGGH